MEGREEVQRRKSEFLLEELRLGFLLWGEVGR